jgi:membrane associated rhomboid family serine protease
MISLYFLGSFLTRLVGEKNFLKVYFAGGVLGNILFILLASPFSIGIGASGAIFALGGALAIMTPRVPVFIFPIPIPVPLWIAIILFLIISFLPSIAWQAHVGGLILGLVAGYLFKKRRRTYYS